jgi:hypothetical protein
MTYQPGLRRLRPEVASGVERVKGEQGQFARRHIVANAAALSRVSD